MADGFGVIITQDLARHFVEPFNPTWENDDYIHHDEILGRMGMPDESGTETNRNHRRFVRIEFGSWDTPKYHIDDAGLPAWGAEWCEDIQNKAEKLQARVAAIRDKYYPVYCESSDTGREKAFRDMVKELMLIPGYLPPEDFDEDSA